MRKISSAKAVVMAVVASIIPVSANASLLGDEITISTALGSQTSVVGAGVEYSVVGGGGGTFNVDFDGSGNVDLFFDLPASTSLGAALAVDAIGLEWVNDPTGFIVDVIELPNGDLPISSLTHGTNSISWVIANFTIPQGVSLSSFEIVTNHGIPEPIGLALVGIGLVGIGYQRRKQSKLT